jgi:ABC-type transporter Mla MlaB component
MLRIATTYRLAETGPSYILRLTGSLQGDWVQELRRSWRVLRDAIAAVPIRVELADVECVDAASRVLLAEMRRAGVEILAGKSLGAAIVDDDGVNTIAGALTSAGSRRATCRAAGQHRATGRRDGGAGRWGSGFK